MVSNSVIILIIILNIGIDWLIVLISSHFERKIVVSNSLLWLPTNVAELFIIGISLDLIVGSTGDISSSLVGLQH